MITVLRAAIGDVTLRTGVRLNDVLALTGLAIGLDTTTLCFATGLVVAARGATCFGVLRTTGLLTTAFCLGLLKLRELKLLRLELKPPPLRLLASASAITAKTINVPIRAEISFFNFETLLNFDYVKLRMFSLRQ